MLSARNLSLSRRDPHGEVRWKRPSVAAVTDMLKNPAYGGAFVYGRNQLRPTNQAETRPSKTLRPMSEWRIVVNGKYLAYVSWDTLEGSGRPTRQSERLSEHQGPRGSTRRRRFAAWHHLVRGMRA
ncbi:recombinase family protein [Bradyrhizobium sp. SSUT77]|uniref:recombinase family protein n=1 Tax=Bradyrhizobium sp. SSUT77 TaxID=3040603 RepID=UPI00244ADAA4|nr:recombinase family protein [Bradyrhizobium sp. SSUT77]MDH2349019.1 recombinase family protein [Bradyrhizobium sp. SSUT77]